MTAVRRRLWNFAAAVSLVLCLASVGLWVRGHFVEDDIGRVHRIYIDHDTALVFVNELISTNGSVGFWRQRNYFQPGRSTSDAEWPEAVEWFHDSRSAIQYRGAYGLNLLGFASRNFGRSSSFYDWMLFVPMIPISVVLAVLPLSWFNRWKRRRICIANNLCVSCGYSLTGNVSGVCPECGTPVAKKAST